jgi:hypothetical protein
MKTKPTPKTVLKKTALFIMAMALHGSLAFGQNPQFVWGRQPGSTGGEYGGDVAADTVGNSWFAGSTGGSLGGPALGGNDIVVGKYDPSGNRLWVTQPGTAQDDYANAITLDPQGNAYITGQTAGKLGDTQFGGQDAFICELNTNGVVLWIRQFGTSGTDTGIAIKLDAGGNIFVAGATTGTLGASQFGGQDCFLSKFDPNGQLLWTRQWGTSSDDGANGLAFDQEGNIYVAGQTYGKLGSASYGDVDMFLTKIDPAGNVLWNQQYGTPYPDGANAVVVDDETNVYITGCTYGSMGGPQMGNGDGVVLKLSSTGTLIWQRQFGTAARCDWPKEILLSPGNPKGVIVGGCGSAAQCEAFMRKFDLQGNELWKNEIAPPQTTCGGKIAMDGKGNIFQGGGTSAALYGPQQGNSDIFLAKYLMLDLFPELAISPTNTVYAGSPVVITENFLGGNPPDYYLFRSDGGTGGSLTDIGSWGTNACLNQTPANPGAPYTIQYACVVSNAFGVSTSAVSVLTVLPQSAPVLTTDIGQYGTNIFAFIGGNVNFYANFGLGTLPITNQWLCMPDSGGGYTNVASPTGWYWTLTNVQSGAAGWYQLTATNALGGSNSTPAHLTPVADPGAPTPAGTNMYSYYVYTNNPWAYWKFEETNDTFFSSMQAYDYSGHNFNATYGNSTDGTTNTGCRDGGENIASGQWGPGHGDSFSGFPPTNGCAGSQNGAANGCLTVPPLNLNTNTVTFTMWIRPEHNGTPGRLISNGLFMNRNGDDAAGMGLGSGSMTNGAGTPCLIYTWNQNAPAAYQWNSGLYPINDIWQFVACVVSPANTTMYQYYVTSTATNMLKSVNYYAVNQNEAFSGGTTWIGGDNYNNALNFAGYIDEVAIFTNALTETQIQAMFLRAIGSTTGVAPAISSNPPNTTVYRGQPLMLSVGAGGIPNPTLFTWQGATNVTGPNGNAVGTLYLPVDGPSTVSRYITGSLTATITFSNYNNSYTYLRAIAQNAYGNATSSWASITKLLAPTNGIWTINFDVTTSQNGGSNAPFAAYGVLGYKTSSIGGGTYWNALSGGNFANTAPSKLDDGVTPSTVNLSCTNSSNGGWFNSGNNLLLDQYMNFGTNGTAMVFTGVPSGKYNLALYGTDAGPGPNYADHGTTFTVQGISQSVTNAQDAQLLPDNTVIYTNLVVTNGTLEVDMIPGWCPKYNSTNSEGDFNGAQLQLVKYAPAFMTVGKINTNTLSWVGGGLMSATNINGPWTTNPGVSPFTFNPTGYQKYFRVYNPTWPN